MVLKDNSRIEEQAITEEKSTCKNVIVVKNDRHQVIDANIKIDPTENVNETVLLIGESQNNQNLENENITSDSVMIVDNIQNIETTEEVTITELYTSDNQGI